MASPLALLAVALLLILLVPIGWMLLLLSVFVFSEVKDASER